MLGPAWTVKSNQINPLPPHTILRARPSTIRLELKAVSYTHLDVYKRQGLDCAETCALDCPLTLTDNIDVEASTPSASPVYLSEFI